MSSQETPRVNEGFSHRPIAGVSVGVRIDGNKAVVAATFRRSNEQFNRRYALQILRGRLDTPTRERSNLLDREDIRVSTESARFARTFPVPEGTTAKQFMRVFRQQFRSGGEQGGEEDVNDSIGRTRSVETQSDIIFTQLAPFVANAMFEPAASTETI